MTRSSSSERHDFGSFDDEYRGFEIGDDGSGRGPLILALALGVLLVFGAVVWNAYADDTRGEDGVLRAIAADTEDYKRVPEEQGGLEVAGQDKHIYDPFDGGNGEEIAVADASAEIEPLEQGGPPIELRPGGRDSGVDPENGMPNNVADQVRALADLEGDADETVRDEPIRQVAETRSSEPEMLEPAGPEPLRAHEDQLAGGFAFRSNGAYLVQLSALRSESAAEEAWNKVRKAQPDLYDGANKFIQRADLGDKGIFYRLRVGAFDERAGADEFCATIKSTGGSCLVVTSN